MDWIKRCIPLWDELKKQGYLVGCQYFSPRQVAVIFEYLGEPVPPESTLIKFIGPPLQDSFMRYCGFDEAKAIRGIQTFRERYAPIGKFENAAAPVPECRKCSQIGRAHV